MIVCCETTVKEAIREQLQSHIVHNTIATKHMTVTIKTRLDALQTTYIPKQNNIMTEQSTIVYCFLQEYVVCDGTV